jgi:hypothetical protein
VNDREYWVTCSNCAWTWGPGPQDDANAAALAHHEETGHEANVSAGDTVALPPDDEP